VALFYKCAASEEVDAGTIPSNYIMPDDGYVDPDALM